MDQLTAERLKMSAEDRGEDPQKMIIFYSTDGKLSMSTEYPSAVCVFVDKLSTLLARNKEGLLPRELQAPIHETWYGIRKEIREQFPVSE